MALLSDIDNGVLIVRSVGDHDLETGFRHMTEAMALAKAQHERSGHKVDMYFDLTESKENWGTDALQAIAKFFIPHMSYLTGRMAVLAPKAVHYGTTRAFGVHSEDTGLQVYVAKDKAELDQWLAGELE